MAFERTITEFEMDATTRQMVQDLRGEESDFEPDLAVDGLSDSILSRILGLFGVGRS
jgi:hypothetical protein